MTKKQYKININHLGVKNPKSLLTSLILSKSIFSLFIQDLIKHFPSPRQGIEDLYLK